MLYKHASSGAEGHLARRRLKPHKLRKYFNMFSRLEFYTMLVGAERGPTQWQQEQADYTRSFFAGYHFTPQEGEVVVNYPLPDSRSDWVKTYFAAWPARLQPVID